MKIKLLKLIDLIFGRLLCLSLGYWDFLFNRTVKAPLISPPRKILVIRPGGLGDFLYLLPLLQNLKRKYPQARVDVLAEKRNAAAGQLTANLDRLWRYDVQPLRTLQALRREKYDVVIDSEQFHNFSAVFAYLTGAKVRIGFKTNPCRNHLYTHLIEYSLVGQEAGEFNRLLEPLGVDRPAVNFADSIAVDKVNQASLPGVKKGYVVVAPRGGARYRCWPPEKYRAVISHLLQNKDRTVVIVGGRAEKKLAAEIIKDLKNSPQVISLVGKTGLLELARLIRESELFVGCDSGIAILAALLGEKTVTIFGSADEHKWGAADGKHLIVRKKLPCAPCQVLGSYKFCRRIDCMADLAAAEVTAAIDRLL